MCIWVAFQIYNKVHLDIPSGQPGLWLIWPALLISKWKGIFNVCSVHMGVPVLYPCLRRLDVESTTEDQGDHTIFSWVWKRTAPMQWNKPSMFVSEMNSTSCDTLHPWMPYKMFKIKPLESLQRDNLTKLYMPWPMRRIDVHVWLIYYFWYL